ncbi:MAG: ATP-binding cassette domain-containing protein [Proteobacteria bacterium]|nr:ATP-binding cassette domain-containing protein [Pseudomonadota bacterium]
MLALQNISKSFSSMRPALDNISFSLQKGDFCVVIGHNGSGKSTLLKAISGEICADKGNIKLNQQDITHHPIHERAQLISSVLQDTTKGTIGEMTLLENLSLSLMRAKKASFGLFKREYQQLKDKMSALGLNLEQYMHEPLANLSGGQRQLIATIMATLARPQLLLLDEHCSALDPKTHHQVMAYTHKMITEQGLTALMITHHLNDAISYGNRLIMLSQGKIILDLNANEKKGLTVPKLLDAFHQYEGATQC